MRDVLQIIRDRHSSRVPFDPERRVSDQDLERILEAARWAPTAHNMQNFEILAIDDRAILAAIAAIRSAPSQAFLRENYRQLSFSEEDLLRKGTGLLAEMFPPAWRRPDAMPEDAVDAEHALLGTAMGHCPLLLIVLYDSRERAPASEGDQLGLMSLGCVMQSIWLVAEALGIALQILSAVGGAEAEGPLRRILAIPDPLKIAFACRLGYPAAAPDGHLRVRREIGAFTHRDRYGKRSLTASAIST